MRALMKRHGMKAKKVECRIEAALQRLENILGVRGPAIVLYVIHETVLGVAFDDRHLQLKRAGSQVFTCDLLRHHLIFQLTLSCKWSSNTVYEVVANQSQVVANEITCFRAPFTASRTDVAWRPHHRAAKDIAGNYSGG